MARAGRVLPASGGLWTYIGPTPMLGQQANFAGDTFGPTFSATGRITAIAIDPSGDIYVGAAGGGVWLSTNGGASFSSIGDSLPTQAIGSVAIDSTNTPTFPYTVYVGTGEGNDAARQLLRAGNVREHRHGHALDAGRWSQQQVRSNGAYQTFDSIAIPCSYLFVGTGNGISASRADADFLECDPTQFPNCPDGAIYESLSAGATGSWHRTFGINESRCPMARMSSMLSWVT